jgi:poly-gamma-glutamate synthase PgsB/CapB
MDMISLKVLVVLFLLLVILGAAEFAAHKRRLAKIPIRIHVNGTRGKSSVTRLIAAGLREGGIVTCAKTTGTLPRLILPNDREIPVYRPSKANVIEQVRIVAAAAAHKAKALVIECMALQPEYQWLSEAKFVRATHGVITNTREDHLDVMGPTEADVALALAGMAPRNGVCYTAEQEHLGILEEACRDRGSKLIGITPEEFTEVTEEELDAFEYRAHGENVALALRICRDVGVDREVALRGMQKSKPDAGAMTEHTIEFFGKKIVFVNGFAANDPESTEMIWRSTLERHPDLETTVALFNLRADRPDRSVQLARAYLHWPQADSVVLMGDGTYIFARTAVKAGLDETKILFAEGQWVDDTFETLVGLIKTSGLIMGMANIYGPGLELVTYFKNREAPKETS